MQSCAASVVSGSPVRPHNHPKDREMFQLKFYEATLVDRLITAWMRTNGVRIIIPPLYKKD